MKSAAVAPDGAAEPARSAVVCTELVGVRRGTFGWYALRSLPRVLWTLAHIALGAVLLGLDDIGVDDAERAGFAAILGATTAAYWIAIALGPGVVSTNAEANPELRWCEACAVRQPLRSKHCRECGRCVRRYDHHCPWLGTCVGERNAVAFWCYLLLQVATLGFGLAASVRAVARESAAAPLPASTRSAVVALAVLCSVFALMPCSLLCFHSWLLLTSQTTWEVASRERITYLRDLHRDALPFDAGPVRNLRRICTAPCGAPVEWRIERATPPSGTPPPTLWRNAWWECC